jgi:CRP/FNR family transcriptional regulator, anaerobic regulatory protein
MPRKAQQTSRADAGPTLRAKAFVRREGHKTISLLSRRQRQQLVDIATQVQVAAGTVVYREKTPATSVYFNAAGVVKAFRDLPSGRRWVTAFLFPEDLFGLAENGVYVRSAQAITPATLYRVDTDALRRTLRRDPELEFHFLCKVIHELREAQHHTMVVGRRDAIGRLAMFFRHLEEHRWPPREPGNGNIDVPMKRSDMANYLGLSAEAVSRATRMLERRGLLKFSGRHRVEILDRRQFDRLVARV